MNRYNTLPDRLSSSIFSNAGIVRFARQLCSIDCHIELTHLQSQDSSQSQAANRIRIPHLRILLLQGRFSTPHLSFRDQFLSMTNDSLKPALAEVKVSQFIGKTCWGVFEGCSNERSRQDICFLRVESTIARQSHSPREQDRGVRVHGTLFRPFKLGESGFTVIWRADQDQT